MRHVHALVPLVVVVLTASRAPAQAVEQESGPTLHAQLFADFNYAETQRTSAEGFRSGQIATHVIAGLSQRVTFFTEVSISTSNVGSSVEAERAFIRYDHADLLKLSAGRFHPPVAYWNTAFHHGQWLATTTGMPEMLRGGGLLVPRHFVGILAEGALTEGPLRVDYTAGVGNGRSTNIGRAGDAGDANNSRAVVAATTLRLPRATGLQLGVSYYADRLTPNDTTDVDERTFSAFVVRENDAAEFIGEYVRVAHDPHGRPGRTTYSTGYYGQIGYRLPGRASAFKPYLRLDRVIAPRSDAVFGPMRMNYDGRIAGVRYDVGGQSALKLEYRGERLEGGRRLGTVAAQISFTFALAGAGGAHHAPVADAGAPAHEGRDDR